MGEGVQIFFDELSCDRLKTFDTFIHIMKILSPSLQFPHFSMFFEIVAFLTINVIFERFFPPINVTYKINIFNRGGGKVYFKSAKPSNSISKSK